MQDAINLVRDALKAAGYEIVLFVPAENVLNVRDPNELDDQPISIRFSQSAPK